MSKLLYTKGQSGFATVLVFVFVVIAVGLAIFAINKPDREKTPNTTAESLAPRVQQQQGLPKASPFPFQEMTIPYLSGREYRSSLEELQKVSDGPAYISSVASYDSDGLRQYGLLTQPKGQMPEGGWPAIIFIHGYIPPTSYRTTQNYVSYVDYFARNGFVVFKIDLRGHDKSQGEPGGAYYSEDYIIDTLNAYAALETTDFVKKGAIGLWGHSMAGNVVMRAFAARPTIPGVVIWAGAGYTYADLQQYRIQDSSYRPPSQDSERTRKRQELRNTYGEFSAENEFWRKVAVTDYLKDLKGAIEIHHATNDNVVSVDYSRNLMSLLDKTQVPHRLYEYQSGGHNLEGSAFTQAMQRSLEFYRIYLK